MSAASSSAPDSVQSARATPSVEQAIEMTENGIYDLAFILRPVPIEQVRAVAATDENMPPKSTYFFPKVMTGFVFSPVG